MMRSKDRKYRRRILLLLSISLNLRQNSVVDLIVLLVVVEVDRKSIFCDDDDA